MSALVDTPSGAAAPGSRLGIEYACGGHEAGLRSPLPPTVRRERPTTDAGPLPARWTRGSYAGRYLHAGGPQVIATEDGRAIVFVDVGGHLADVEADVRDVADLVAWLRRGGR